MNESEQAQTIVKRPVMKSESSEYPKSRAVFYSILWPSMRKAAIELGWALALHGSLENDMDVMGMPWTEDCRPHQELAKAVSDCLGDTIWREYHITPHYTKPHGRIVYTLSIGGSWHIDLSIMPPPGNLVDSQAQKIAGLCRLLNRYEKRRQAQAARITKQAQKIEKLLAENNVLAILVDELKADRKAQAKEIDRLKAIESELESVKRMSSGVAGFHLNGETATWDEVGL